MQIELAEKKDNQDDNDNINNNNLIENKKYFSKDNEIKNEMLLNQRFDKYYLEILAFCYIIIGRFLYILSLKGNRNLNV